MQDSLMKKKAGCTIHIYANLATSSQFIKSVLNPRNGVDERGIFSFLM